MLDWKASSDSRCIPRPIVIVDDTACTAADEECGLWSAGRTTFAHGEMRHHLVQYFQAKMLMPFPGGSKKVHRCRRKHLFIPVYCICGLPEPHDSDMISCDRCGQWFHFRCMHI